MINMTMMKRVVRIIGLLFFSAGGVWLCTQDFFLAAVMRGAEIVQTGDWTNFCTNERWDAFQKKYGSNPLTEPMILEGIEILSRCPKFPNSSNTLKFLKEELAQKNIKPAPTPLVASPQEGHAETKKSEVPIKYLSPRAIKELPKAAAEFFESRKCMVPVTSDCHYEDELLNIKSGEFAARGQRDWAILCSVGGVSSIMVFWGGSIRCADTVNEAPDSNSHAENPSYAFTRYIDVVGKGFIDDHAEAYGGPKPPSDEHDGIEDGTRGQASEVAYCHKGDWKILQGAD